MENSRWTNWGGNQSFQPDGMVKPATEEEAIERVCASIKAGKRVRVAGGGHSFTPIVETSGSLFDFSNLSGVISTHPNSHRAVVWGGSRIAALGEPLWDAGLSLANQGDIDVQSIAGAVATGTKGSGVGFGSLSSALTSLRVIDGRGDIVDIDETKPELLRAAQVSIGLLGPVLRVGLKLVPAYGLKEENVILPMKEVLRQWDYFLTEYRHFSFWWMPAARSAYMYKLGDVPADSCFVKLLREVPASMAEVPVGKPNRRMDRAYRIYPDGTTIAEFHELEYMVAAKDAREVVEMMRGLMLKNFPNEVSPLQVRWQKADQGYLSAQNGRDSTSISVSGEIGRDYLPFLRAVDRALQPFDARPHWGKLHFLNAQRVRALYPDFEKFQAVRRQMDPTSLFLNAHLEKLFA